MSIVVGVAEMSVAGKVGVAGEVGVAEMSVAGKVGVAEMSVAGKVGVDGEVGVAGVVDVADVVGKLDYEVLGGCTVDSGTYCGGLCPKAYG